MECKKCNNIGTLILRKNDSYCDNCFLSSTNHKFRACIGKNKILSSNEKVLVCLSEGLGSMALLDLIYNGITLESHKKLRIKPFFLHLLDSNSSQNMMQAEYVREQCKKYKFDVYMSHISSFMNSNNELPETNIIPALDNVSEEKFHTMMKGMPSTASNDLLQKVKRNLFIIFAKLLQCKFIFTAETTTTLAINLLSNLALGRGSQIENDIGFCDTRDVVKILRPMRDISKEELDLYVKIKQLDYMPSSDSRENSLQTVIENFVIDLHENFQATISTVCKTADKIGILDDNDGTEGKCVICESRLDTENFKLTALQATNFSKIVSGGPDDLKDCLLNNPKIPKDLDKVMFPFIHKSLCYGCSRNYNEMERGILPNNVYKSLNK